MFIADTHCDTLFSLAIGGKQLKDCMVSHENLTKGGVCLQTLALFTGANGPAGTPYADALKMLEAAHDLPFPVLYGDLPDNPPEEITGIISIEGGEALEGKTERLYEFDRLARVRMIALTWNHENEIGYPAKLGPKPGLKPFGFELIREMDRLGVYADVSHLNEAGFWDLCENMKLPPIASHSNFRELCDVPRNLTRKQVQTIIDRNGYIGINFYPHFLTANGKAGISDVLRHMDAIADMGGIGAMGFGSDFDGIEVQPEGLENASKFPDLIDAMLRHGYSDEQVKGIAGMNFWRLLKRAEAVRAK